MNPAEEKPQFPPTNVVIPCIVKGVFSSSFPLEGMNQSLWECMSIKPGAMTLPAQSIVLHFMLISLSDKRSIRSPLISRFPCRAFLPVPSTIRPFFSRMRESFFIPEPSFGL